MLVKKLILDRSGNFGVLTAILGTLLCGVAGLAVDVSIAMAKKASIQHAADAAVLSVVQAAPASQPIAQALVKKAFFSNLKPELAETTELSEVTIQPDKRLTMTATTKIPLTLGTALFPHGLTVSVLAEAERGIANTVEVALVLDTTGSMQGQKIKDLRSAAKALINVFATKGNGKAKLSLVPFSDYVNVGLSNRSQPWLSVQADSSVTKNVCTTSTPLVSKSGCTIVSTTTYVDGVATPSSKEVCTSYVYGNPKTTCQNQTTTTAWYGCVGSRSAPLDQSDLQPATPYTGLMNVKCGSPLTPLTSNYTALSTAVDAMTVQNNTYIPAGMIWGVNTLSPTAPFTESQSGNGDTKQYIVLMTDGDNSLRALYPTHGGAINGNATNDTLTRTASNSTLSAVCGYAKDRGITVFTIAVGSLLPTSINALRDCATDPAKAITVADSSKLVSVFEEIAGLMMSTRLTQ